MTDILLDDALDDVDDDMDTDEPDRTPDPKLWDLYINECKHLQIRPSHKDYLIWIAEQDSDRTERDYE